MINDVDVYGLDMWINEASQVKENGIPINFVFNVESRKGAEGLCLKYKSMIEKLGLTGRFLLLNEDLSFVKLIEQADLVLRPTNTDGDALTVREALCLGKPIIASDIVERPLGTILFKSRAT